MTAFPATAGTARRPAGRVALLVLGGVSLLIGLDAALLRLGVWAPLSATSAADAHGMVMVLGFLGTLIAVERAQSLGATWGYLAPALLGTGALTVAAGGMAGKLLLAEGAWLFAAVLWALWRRAPTGSVAAQVAGVVLAAVAATLWFRVEVPALLPLLASFLVITIAAERAGMAQLTLGARAPAILVGLTCWLVTASTISLVHPDAGARAVGVGCLATAGWLARDDIARRMVRTTGLRRFNGVALMLGYFWLALGGVTWAVAGVPDRQGSYDLIIHTIFVGFGLSMVLAHAPIIFPAVLGRPLPFAPLLWVPLTLLHGGMAVRVAGDLAAVATWWQVGGMVQVVAALTMAGSILALAVRGDRTPPRTPAATPPHPPRGRPASAGTAPASGPAGGPTR